MKDRFFEDFTLREIITHATPRTLTEGDAALYQGLYGGRHILSSAAPEAQKCGYRDRPLDDWLVFHIVFGKSVPDVSLNAVANLGYAEGVFGAPAYAGDTLYVESEVIGLKENKSGKTGIVYVRTTAANQQGETVLRYCRWVMVQKRDPAAKMNASHVPELRAHLAADDLQPPAGEFRNLNPAASGSDKFWDDFTIGERLIHNTGTTLEEAEHMLATRLYQNTAKVHFDALLQADSRFGKRLIYGGHIISHMRAISFQGLENALCVAGLNGGTHVAPAFAGDTIYGFSEILDKAVFAGREDIAALRVRHVAVKNKAPTDFPPAALPPAALPPTDDPLADDPGLILDMDVWYGMPRL